MMLHTKAPRQQQTTSNIKNSKSNECHVSIQREPHQHHMNLASASYEYHIYMTWKPRQYATTATSAHPTPPPLTAPLIRQTLDTTHKRTKLLQPRQRGTPPQIRRPGTPGHHRMGPSYQRTARRMGTCRSAPKLVAEARLCLHPSQHCSYRGLHQATNPYHPPCPVPYCDHRYYNFNAVVGMGVVCCCRRCAGRWGGCLMGAGKVAERWTEATLLTQQCRCRAACRWPKIACQQVWAVVGCGYKL